MIFLRKKVLLQNGYWVYNNSISKKGEITMATWEGIKDSLFAAGRDVSQKAKEVSEVAKLKMDIRTKEEFVEKQFAALGRAYYEANEASEKDCDAEQFAVIREALDEIERMNRQMLEIQGVVVCPNCGKKVPSDNSYCSACGAKLDDIVADAEVLSEETVEESTVSAEPIVSEPEEAETPCEDTLEDEKETEE